MVSFTCENNGGELLFTMRSTKIVALQNHYDGS